MASGERGFKGILLSSIFGKCKVSFYCSPQPVLFQTDGNTYFIEIFDGCGRFTDIYNFPNQGKESHQESSSNISFNNNITISNDSAKATISSNQNPSDNDSQNFEQIINADSHNIEGTDDDFLITKISRIVEYFKVICMALYDSPVTKINLTFGIENNKYQKIHLIDGNVTTTPNTYTTFLFKSIPGGEETFIDYFISSVLYDPNQFEPIQNDSKSSKTNTNFYDDSNNLEEDEDDTNSSFSIQSDSTTSIYSEIDNNDNSLFEYKGQIKDKTSRSKRSKNYQYFPVCYSNFTDCKKGKFKCPILYVIYYFAKQKFPEIDEAKLYTLLKIRLFKTKTNKEVNVCIRCVHLYTEQKRDHQIEKNDQLFIQMKKIQSYEDDHLFIKKTLPPEIKITKEKIRIRSKKAPLSIRRMVEGKPSHKLNGFQNLPKTKNNEEWNNFYDNLTKRKNKSTSYSFNFVSKSFLSYTKSGPLSIQKVKKSKKNIEIPHFEPSKSDALKKAPEAYSNRNLSRKSWDTENIIRRFQSKNYSQNDPQYIEPRNIHITEM